jgi:polysaccharide export outer membrane protein
MSFSKMILAGFLFCFMLIPVVGKCAQSTADATVSDAVKEAARKEILAAKPKNGAQSNEYVIGIGDLLSVSIFGEGDMAAPSAIGNGAAAGSLPPGGAAGAPSPNNIASVEVRVDGQISLKHIGDVKAVGMTLTQLADYLKKLYSPIFDNPNVSTVLVKNNSWKYSVLGKVTNAGVYPLIVETSLVEAIARCGGFNEWANREVTVVRKNVQEQDKDLFKDNALEFDYSDFIKGKGLQKNVAIQNDDVIIVH